MAEQKTLVGYDQILGVLADLCRSNRTGTLFITTSDKHSARFVLQDGQVVSCNYSMKRGHDAIPLLKTIKAGSYHFADGVFSAITEVPLPPTEALLSSISPAGGTNTGSAALGISQGSAAQSPTGTVNVEALLAAVKKELAINLGPIAEMLLDDYIDDNGKPSTSDEVRAFLNTMASELRNASKAQAFMTKMLKIAS